MYTPAFAANFRAVRMAAIRRCQWRWIEVKEMKKNLIVLVALLIPLAGIAKDKQGGPDYVPITQYSTLAQTYGASTGSIYALFDFAEPYLLHSIELTVDRLGATTTECDSEIQLHDKVNPGYTVLARKSWRSAGDTGILRLEFPTPVLVDPQTHTLALMIEPTSGGYCAVTLNGIASAP